MKLSFLVEIYDTLGQLRGRALTHYPHFVDKKNGEPERVSEFPAGTQQISGIVGSWTRAMH